MAKILIDPGHGGSETGAVNNVIQEKAINLSVAFLLKKMLESKGFEVQMTRYTDTQVGLQERCDIANAWGADLFISVHHNANDGISKGFEVYCSVNPASMGRKFAFMLAEEYKKVGHSPSKLQEWKVSDGVHARPYGIGKDYYAVIKYTNMPAIISEFAYMDNPCDYSTIDTQEEYQIEAKAICNACCTYFGVNPVNPELTTDEVLTILAANKIIGSPEHWKNVFEGKINPVSEYVKIAFRRMADYIKSR